MASNAQGGGGSGVADVVSRTTQFIRQAQGEADAAARQAHEESRAKANAARAAADEQIRVIRQREATTRALRQNAAAMKRKAERLARQNPAARAREVAGIRSVSLPYTPSRQEVRTMARSMNDNLSLAPPSHVVRRQAGLGLPSGRDLAESLAGVILGAAIPAIFVALAPNPGAKWVTALLTAATGALFVSTSPVGTFAQDVGMGAFASAGGWMWYDVSGSLLAPSQAVGAAGVTDPPVNLGSYERFRVA